MQRWEKAGEGARGRLSATGMTFVLAAVLFLAGSGEAATWTVTSRTDDGAAGTLRSVVAGAVDGDIVLFDSTVRTVELKGPLFLNKALTVKGPVIIRQMATGARVLYVTGDCTLENLTITGGNLGTTNTAPGAGVFTYANLTMKNCTVTGNTGGGGIHNGKNLILTNCAIVGNFSTGSNTAGGISNTDYGYNAPTLTMTDCLVGNNNSSEGISGGIYNGVKGTLTMGRCTVHNNHNSNLGGGMYLSTSSIATNLTDYCVVTENSPDNIHCSYNASYTTDSTCTIGNSPNESATAFAGYAGDAEPQPRSIADDPDVTAVENALADSGSDLFATVEAALSGDLNGTSGSVTAALAGITASLYYANTFEDVALEGDDLVVEYTASYPERARYYALFARADGSGYESPERGVQFEIRPGQDLPEGVTPPDFYEEGEGLMTWRNVVADGGPYDLNPDPGVVTFRVCSVRAAATGTPASGGCSVGAVGGTASTLPLTLLLGIPFLATRGDSRGRQQAPRCQSRRGH